MDNLRYEAEQDVQLAMSMMEGFKVQVNQVKLKIEAFEQNVSDNTALQERIERLTKQFNADHSGIKPSMGPKYSWFST